MEYCTNLKIGKENIKIKLPPCFCQLAPFLEQFKKVWPKSVDNIITLQFDTRRHFEIAENQLNISGPDLSNLEKIYNLPTLYQLFYRFSALRSLNKGKKLLLLHGSTVINQEGEAILIGDDGNSGCSGKTLLSLELALRSKKYCVDEFTFFDLNNLKIIGDEVIPIHIRPIVKNHLLAYHRLSFSNKNIDSYLVPKDLDFQVIKSTNLNKIIYPYLNKSYNKVIKLKEDEAYKCFIICGMGHIVKMLNPKLDRTRFDEGSDNITPKAISFSMCQKMLPKKLEGEIKKVIRAIPSYRIYIKSPCGFSKLNFPRV